MTFFCILSCSSGQWNFNCGRQKVLKKFLFIGIAVLIFSVNTLSQTTSTPKEEDFQSWNDIQITVPIDKKTDFILTGTFRFGENVERLVDRRVAIAFNYKITDWLAVQPGYTNIVTTPRAGNRRTENRLNFAATYKFPFKKFTLTDRNLFERRLRSPQDSTRYRNRLQLEIPLKKFYDTRFFTSNEVFYDWSLKKWSRNRFTVGLGKNFTKNFGLDVYYMRQNDGTTRPGDLNVVGTTFKVRP
jgi:hypothetical protein